MSVLIDRWYWQQIYRWWITQEVSSSPPRTPERPSNSSNFPSTWLSESRTTSSILTTSWPSALMLVTRLYVVVFLALCKILGIIIALFSSPQLKVKVNTALFLPDFQGGLWLSLDFGAKWTKVHDGVHSFSWWEIKGNKTTHTKWQALKESRC